VPPLAAETLTAFRFLRSVLDVRSLEIDFDSVTAVMSAQKHNTNNMFNEMANIIDSIAEWKERKSSLLKSLLQAKVFLPKMAAKLEGLPSEPFGFDDATSVENLSQAFSLIREAKAELRAGSTLTLETKAKELMTKIVAHVEADDRGVGLRSLSPTHAQIMQDLLKEAIGLWQDPDHRSTLAMLEEESESRINSQILVDIQASFEQAVVTTTTDIDTAKFEVVGKMAKENVGLVFQVDQVSRIVESTGMLHQFLAANFPQNIEFLSVAKALLQMCPDSAGTEGLRRQITVLAAGGKVQEALATHRRLGDDVYGRVMNDEANATIAVLLQKRLLFLKGMQEITEEPPACLTTLVQEVDQHVEEVTQATLTPMQAKLANMIASAEPWARGGPDGSSWFSEAKDNSDIAEVLAIGSKTVCARPVTVYQSTRDQMDIVLKKLVETSALFTTMVAEDGKTMATNMMNDLALSHIEGLLIALYTSNFQKEVMKTKTHGIKKLVKAPLKWAMVHEALRARADRAIKFL
jgi:hypothetical protein